MNKLKLLQGPANTRPLGVKFSSANNQKIRSISFFDVSSEDPSLGELSLFSTWRFFRASDSQSNVIGSRQHLPRNLRSLTNHNTFILARAKKFAQWKTSFSRTITYEPCSLRLLPVRQVLPHLLHLPYLFQGWLTMRRVEIIRVRCIPVWSIRLIVKYFTNFTKDLVRVFLQFLYLQNKLFHTNACDTTNTGTNSHCWDKQTSWYLYEENTVKSLDGVH